jgi:hypothetical protein
LDIVKEIVNYWNQMRTNPLDPNKILQNSGTASRNRAYFEDVVLPAIASGTASGSQVTDYVNATNQALGRPRGSYVALAKGGLVPKYFVDGGFARGTDTVPAMLTPGEFVMSKYAVQKYGVDKMRAINNGAQSSDSVYNYEVNVNVKTDANADQIARSVIGQIKQIDSQRIRGNKF